MDGEQIAPTKPILREITERLAALTPEQFVPPVKDSEKDPFVQVVGCASDEVKRLHTLIRLIEKEENDRDEELDGIERDLERDYDHDRLVDILTTARNGTPDERLDRFYALEEEQRRSAALHVILSAMLDEEMRREYSYLAGRATLAILPDWSVGWTEDGHDDVEGGVVLKVYDFGVVSLKFAFAEMSRPRRRR